MWPLRKIIAILSGIILAVGFLLINPFHSDANACKVSAIAILVITWWIAEALPMAVVALIPLILLPLAGICKIDEAAAPYANPIIYLCFGGLMIGIAIEKWSLHKRIALNIVRITGTSGNMIILGFIVATGCLSMWLSNTATTMMMLPVAMSVIAVMEENHTPGEGNMKNFSVCLLLSIAYASNIGGISTIIGTAPNVVFVAFLEKNNQYTFDFREWMFFCIPLATVLLLVLYFVLVKVLYPNRLPASKHAKEVISQELHTLGKISKPEVRVMLIFLFTVLLWVTRDMLNAKQSFFKLDDTMIAVFGAFMLFVIPSGSADMGRQALMEWEDTHKMPWGILLLFGGGIALATQLEKAGLMQQLGAWVAGFSSPGFLLLLVVALLSVFISEVMSNTAQVIIFTPVVAGIASALHMDILQLGMAMTLSASCAFMMPMGTPPNAIVFASGKLKLSNMTAAGFVMNVLSAVLISLFCWFVLPHMVQPLK